MARNLVSNPSFETNTTGWSAVNGAISRVAGTWGAGAWTGRLTVTSGSTTAKAIYGTTVDIEAAPDDRFFVSAKLKAGTGADGVRVHLEVWFFDISDNPTSFWAGDDVYISSTPVTAYILRSIQADPNTVRAEVHIIATAADLSASDQIDIDMVDARANEMPDGYFDGSFPNAAWVGTANASPSVRVPIVSTYNPQAWKSGGVQVEGFLYRCDRYNHRIDDLSQYIVNGSVGWNADRGVGVKMGGDFRLNRRGLVEAYVDFVAPVLRLTWNDGTVEERQYGLFLVDWPEDTIYQKQAVQSFKGLDSTWFPYNVPLLDTINFDDTDNVVGEMQALIESTSWDRVSFPAMSRTFGVDTSAIPPQRVYDVVAKQFDAAGLYYPYSDLDGTITTQPYIDLGTATPDITVTMEDPVGEWSVVPTTTTLANIVQVSKENVAGGDDPIVSIAENLDPASKISQVYRPPIMRAITNSEIQSQADADMLALQYLRESTSFYRVIKGKLSAGTWMRPYSVMDSYLEDEAWGSIAGRYHVREWGVGFTQSDAEVSVEANMWVDFNEGGL